MPSRSAGDAIMESRQLPQVHRADHTPVHGCKKDPLIQGRRELAILENKLKFPDKRAVI